MFAPHLRPARAFIKLNDISPAEKVIMAKASGFISDADFNKANAGQQKDGIVVGMPGVKPVVKKVERLLLDLGFVMVGGGGDFDKKAKKKNLRLDLGLYAELVEAGIAKPLEAPKAKVFVSSGKRG